MFARVSMVTYLATLSIVAGQDDASRRLIGVYVANGADGFTSSGGGDSSLDLAKSLGHKEKTLRVVDTAANADLVVKVISRNEVKEPGVITTSSNNSKDGKRQTATIVPTQNTRRIVHAAIKAGDFETELQGESIVWRGAADDLAGQIDHWVKQNYARLIEKRLETKGNSEKMEQAAMPVKQGTPMSAAEDVAIKAGMTTEQVADAMGQPLKKVNFGQKSLWNYKGMQVVFENGRVSDVKF